MWDGSYGYGMIQIYVDALQHYITLVQSSHRVFQNTIILCVGRVKLATIRISEKMQVAIIVIFMRIKQPSYVTFNWDLHLEEEKNVWKQTKNLIINMEIRVMMIFCIFHLSVGAVIKTWNYQILYQRNCFYLLVAIVCNFLINLNLIPAWKHRAG